MHKILTGILVSTLLVSGCSWSGSQANPKNWFGRGQPSNAPPPAEEINPLIPGTGVQVFKRPEAEDTSVPIAQVNELRIDPTPTGAIVQATGTATRQGAYAVELRPDHPELLADNGVLSFSFRVRYPEDPTPVGNDRTRLVV